MRKPRGILVKVLAALLVAVAGYAGLLAYPEPLFKHSVTYHGIAFNSRSPVGPQLSAIADTVNRRLATSELYSSSGTQRVFLVDRRWLWTFLNGPYRHAIARNVELTGAILIPHLDVASQRICHFDGRCAGAVNILTHEGVHTLVRRHIGVLRLWRLPWWQREGYAEYIASERATQSEAPPAYQQAALAWKELIEVRGLTFDQIVHSRTVDAAASSASPSASRT